MNARVAAITFTILGFAASANAAPVLVFNEATGGSGLNQNQSVGWQFNVLSAVSVTGLGYFDEGADGLGREHTVGIWNPAGALLASVLVPAGTVASFDGQFRTIPIVPLVLTAGMGYIVGAENFNDSGDRLAANVAFTTDASIQFVDATFSAIGSGFTRPTSFSVATSGFFGPSFSIGPTAPAPVPEPTSLLLLGTGAAGLIAKARGRRRKQQVQ